MNWVPLNFEAFLCFLLGEHAYWESMQICTWHAPGITFPTKTKSLWGIESRLSYPPKNLTWFTWKFWAPLEFWNYFRRFFFYQSHPESLANSQPFSTLGGLFPVFFPPFLRESVLPYNHHEPRPQDLDRSYRRFDASASTLPAQVRVVTPWDHVISWTVTEEPTLSDDSEIGCHVILWRCCCFGCCSHGVAMNAMLTHFIYGGRASQYRCCVRFFSQGFNKGILICKMSWLKTSLCNLGLKTWWYFCWIAWKTLGFFQINTARLRKTNVFRTSKTIDPTGVLGWRRVGGVSKTGVDSSRTRSITFLGRQPRIWEHVFFWTEKPSWGRTLWITNKNKN